MHDSIFLKLSSFAAVSVGLFHPQELYLLRYLGLQNSTNSAFEENSLLPQHEELLGTELSPSSLVLKS